MDNSKFYRVTFEIKRNGRKAYFMDVLAANAKEAKEKTEALWYEANTAHAFHVTARALTTEVLAEYFARCADYGIKA